MCPLSKIFLHSFLSLGVGTAHGLCIYLMLCIGHPIFFWKTGTNSTVDFGPNPDWTPIFSQFGSCLTMCMRLRRSPDRANSNQTRHLRSFIHVVKRLPNWLKIGVQSGFGLKSTVEFVPVFQKNWAGLLHTLGLPKNFGVSIFKLHS